MESATRKGSVKLEQSLVMGLTVLRAEKGSSGTNDNSDKKPETSLIMRTNIDLLEDRVGGRPALIGRRGSKLQRLIALASLPLLMWLGDPCIAQPEPETICHTVNVEPARLDWIAPIEIPQFDPRLGNLESVTIQVEASTSTDFRAENVRNSGAAGTFAPVEVSISTTVSLRSGDAVLAAANPKVYRVEYLAARYDGVRDFAGASGVTRLGIAASDTAITVLTAANGDDLGAFVGEGKVSMTLAASSLAEVKGPGNLVVWVKTDAGGTVKACYAYRRNPPGSGFYVFVEGQTVCEGEAGVLTAQVITEGNGSASGSYQYFWYDPQDNVVTENGNPVNSPSIQVEEQGVYRVQVVDGNGIIAEATGELVVLQTFEPGLTIPTPLPTAGQQGTLAPINIDPNASYEWAIVESTGPGWAILDGQNSAIVTYRAGSSGTAVFSLTVTYPNGCPKQASIRFGLNPGEGCTIGFWRNKNGMLLITADDFSDLNRLRLRNANGSDRDFDLSSYSLDYNKGVLRNWLTYASSVNMAYMLSAQLAAFTLNVRHGFYTPETLIPVTVGGVTHLYKAIDLIEEVNAMLSDTNDVNGDGKEDGAYVPKGHPNRALFEAYSNALDTANNNCRR